MISFLTLLAASAPTIAACAGLDTTLATGLAVNVESVPEPISVDGVSMTVQHVTGTGVAELVRRIETSWRRQGSELDRRQQDSWNVLSRLHGGYSEVLQWRTHIRDPELLLSLVDLRKPVLSLPAAGLILPAGCIWGRNITGSAGTQVYLQRSAQCPHSLHALSMQLQQSLSAQGWTVRVASDTGLLVGRAGAEGFVGLSAQGDKSATWVTWLRVERGQ